MFAVKNFCCIHTSTTMGSKDFGLIPYFILSSIILLLLTTYLLRSYAHISVPSHARLIVWLSWTLCFSIVYILPMDLRPHVGNNDAMYPFYVALYWLCFFLTWILTPFQSAFIKSGGFDTKERIFDAIKLNIIFFIVVKWFIHDILAHHIDVFYFTLYRLVLQVL